MLDKKSRTPVQKFSRKAQTIHRGRFFVVKKSDNTLSYSRVGVVAGKAAVRGATKRNKVRRIVMDEFRREARTLQEPGSDYLVIINASDKLDDADYEKIAKELKAFLAKKQK